MLSKYWPKVGQHVYYSIACWPTWAYTMAIWRPTAGRSLRTDSASLSASLRWDERAELTPPRSASGRGPCGFGGEWINELFQHESLIRFIARGCRLRIWYLGNILNVSCSWFNDRISEAKIASRKFSEFQKIPEDAEAFSRVSMKFHENS